MALVGGFHLLFCQSLVQYTGLVIGRINQKSKILLFLCFNFFSNIFYFLIQHHIVQYTGLCGVGIMLYLKIF